MIKKGEFIQANLDLKNFSEIPEIQILKAEVKRELGQLGAAIEIIQNLMKKNVEKKHQFAANVELAYLNYRKDDLINALQINETAEKILLEIKNKDTYITQYETKMHTIYGNIFWKKGILDNAKNAYSKALEKATSESFHLDHIHALICLSNIYAEDGSYELSLQYLSRAKKDAKKYENKKFLGYIENNLGEIFRLRGNYNKAIDHYKIAEEYFSDYDNDFLNATIVNNIGSCYFHLNKLTKSRECMEIALKRFLKVPSFISASETILYMVRITITSKITNDKDLIAQLGKFASEIDSPLVTARYNIAKSMIHIKRGNLHELHIAKNLLKNIKETSIFHFETQLLANFLLLEIYLINFLNGDTSQKINIVSLLNDLIKFSSKDNNYISSIKIISIHLKMNFLFNDLSENEKLFTKIEVFQKEKDLDEHHAFIPVREEFDILKIQISNLYLEIKATQDKFLINKCVELILKSRPYD